MLATMRPAAPRRAVALSAGPAGASGSAWRAGAAVAVRRRPDDPDPAARRAPASTAGVVLAGLAVGDAVKPGGAEIGRAGVGRGNRGGEDGPAGVGPARIGRRSDLR